MPGADGNPLDEAEAREITRRVAPELRNTAGSYVVPLFWVLEAESQASILQNGSSFFMRVDGPTMLVTAAHVVRGYEADRDRYGNAVTAQVMDVSFDPLKHLIDIDDQIDIATIKVPHGLPARVGKWCYERSSKDWPPPPPSEGRGLFFAGFPGLDRKDLGDGNVEWGLHGGLLTATVVKSDEVISQLDRHYLEPIPGVAPPPLNPWLGGMSGAPGWTVTRVGWRLAGVLVEYSTDFELFYFRRGDCIRPDGTLTR